MGEGGRRKARWHREFQVRVYRGPDEGELLSVPEVASYLGVSPVTVWRFCRDGKLPALRIGRQWRVRREVLEEFLRQRERPATLAGQLRSFLTVPDNVLGIAEGVELLHRLDAAFFGVGEARGALMVKFTGGEPEISEDGLRAALEGNGLDVRRLESERRFRFDGGGESLSERAHALRRFADEKDEGGPGRRVWASFDQTKSVDLRAELGQQEALDEVVEAHRLVVKTVLLERVIDEWPPSVQRSAKAAHSGTIWLSENWLALSRVTPTPPA